MQNQIASLRRERGITQTDLAQSSGIDFRRLSAMENGAADVTPLAAQRIAGILRVDPAELFGSSAASAH